MAGAKPVIYWDTCIWLAWFKDEKRDPDEMAGIRECVEKFEKGELHIATSVLTLAEMLDLSNKLPVKVLRRFRLFFRRPDVVRISVDIRVAELTQKIRDFYFSQFNIDGLPTLELGDALHLASAVHYGCDLFLTFDERDSKKPSKPKRAILPLSGNVAGHALQIRKPTPEKSQLEMELPLRADVEADGERQSIVE